MKKLRMRMIAGALVMAVVLAVPSFGMGNVMASEAVARERTISVTGSGSVTMEPDIATTTFTVSNTEEEMADALAETNRAMNAIINAIGFLGVEDRDIRTTAFSVRQTTMRIEIDEEMVTVPAFNASTVIRVNMRDFDRIGDIIGAATVLGATSIGSVSFSLSDSNAAYLQALRAAAEQARAKADIMALATGAEVDFVISINETSTFNAPSLNVDFEAPPPPSMAPMALASETFHTPIEPGELTVTARVSAVFAIR